MRPAVILFVTVAFLSGVLFLNLGRIAGCEKAGGHMVYTSTASECVR